MGIAGASDQFRFTYRALNGDGTMVLKVATLGNTSASSRSGIMIRESLDANSRNAFVGVTAGSGVVYTRRLTTGGATTTVAGGAGVAPLWLKIDRQGSSIKAYRSADGVNWVLIVSDTIALVRNVWIGSAVSSYNASLTTASSIQTARVTPLLPANWTSADFGASPGIPGSVEFWDNTYTVNASGAGIGGTSDQYRFTYQSASGNGDLVVNMASLISSTGAGQAGVMIRASLDVLSPYVALAISASNGLLFERRLSSGLATITTGVTGVDARWLKLTRRGTIIAAFYSADKVLWTKIGEESLSLPTNTFVGFAATSDDSARTVRAQFDIKSLLPGTPWTTVINSSPTVSLTSPASNWSLTVGDRLSVSANASDPDGTVASVAFYANGTLIGTALTAPYQVLWTPASAGTYSLTAVAKDDAGATTTSSALSGSVIAVADSQAPPPPPPPASVTFTASPDHDTNVFYYSVRIFTADANVSVNTPVTTFDIGKPAVVNGECTADITLFLGGVVPGSYVAVVSAVGLGGESLSPPSATFTN